MGRKFGWHSGKLICKELDVQKSLTLGSLDFGAAEMDSIVIKGRMSTSTVAGAALSLPAAYAYGEGVELRWGIASWTGIGNQFNGMYVRASADVVNASGTIRGMELYGVANAIGVSNLFGLLTYAYVKGATAATIGKAYAIQAELSFDAGQSTKTITTEMTPIYSKVLSGVVSAYTKIHGMIMRFGDMDGGSRVYGNGILIEDDGDTSGTSSLTTGLNVNIVCTTGISLAGANTTGLSITGTYATATSKAIHSAITINNANLTDGYGTNEFDLTLTGTSAGHVACSSSWINMSAGTHGAGGSYIAAQNNGIYEDAAAVITGAKIVFGMRAQAILGDTDAAGVYPFSINTNNTAITALFDVNNLTDLGLITDAGSDDGTLVPLMKDVNGAVKYVKIYSTA